MLVLDEQPTGQFGDALLRVTAWHVTIARLVAVMTISQSLVLPNREP